MCARSRKSSCAGNHPCDGNTPFQGSLMPQGPPTMGPFSVPPTRSSVLKALRVSNQSSSIPSQGSPRPSVGSIHWDQVIRQSGQ